MSAKRNLQPHQSMMRKSGTGFAQKSCENNGLEQDVGSVKMHLALDSQIWDFARENGFAIVSKDSDFHQMSFLYGAPPKTIWLRCGNCNVATLEMIVRKNAAAIGEFLNDSESALLVLEQD